MRICKILLFMFLFLSFYVIGATYYVDFENGNDKNSGTSPSEAWKHCPGDPNAKDIAGSVKLKPGDKVLFKGGVKYRGSLRLKWSGSSDAPITYKGDGWEKGKAIITGADVISQNWTRCSSAADCWGNPNWQNIYYTSIPQGTTFFNRLFQNDEFLWFAQEPDPTDRIQWDNLSEWYKIPKGSTTKSIIVTKEKNQIIAKLTDPDVFTQSDPSYWKGAYIITWVIPNELAIKPITNYDPSTHTIYFNLDNERNVPYTDRDNYYALWNHPALIDQEGEYAFSSDGKIYLWPKRGENPNECLIEQSTRMDAIYGKGVRNIKIEGFIVMASYGPPDIWSGGGGFQIIDSPQIEISKCEFRRISSMSSMDIVRVSGDEFKIIGNVIEESFRNRGITLLGGKNSIIEKNIIRYIGKTGILVMSSKGTIVARNIIENLFGTHGNGISIYDGTSDTIVEENIVRNCASLFTYSATSNLTVRNNLFDGNGVGKIHSWGGNQGFIRFVNNTMVNGAPEGIFHLASKDLEKDTNGNWKVVIETVNNIIDGGNGNIHRYNIYTKRAWWQQKGSGWSFGEGEIPDVTNERLFINPSQKDYRLRPDSPAIDAGIDASNYGVKNDILGTPRPQGSSWDIGAYEYVPPPK